MISDTRPYCPNCGRTLTLYPYRNDEDISDLRTADGQPPMYGGGGDNMFCSQRCGYQMMIKVVASVPGVLDLLPPDWRAQARGSRPRSRTEWVKLIKEFQCAVGEDADTK